MKLFNFFTLLLISTLFIQCSPKTERITSNTIEDTVGISQYKIIGYVAGWRGLDLSSIDANKLTHINYAFANVINGEVKFGGEVDSLNTEELNTNDLNELMKLKDINPNLKILVSVGGWTWSGAFSDVALTDSSRIRFANSAVSFLKNYNLDGIDIDWEYPGQKGAGNTHRSEDKENFTLLLKEVREALDIQGVNDSTHYLLTIASGADQAYVENTNMAEAHKYLDFINIMTYDYYNGWNNETGHHSNLTNATNDPSLDSKCVLSSVDGHIAAGIPVDKIVLGVPFYGRFWNGVNNENNGLFQPAKTYGDFIFYHQIVKNCNEENGFKRYWDKTAQAPYLWSENSLTFISYEDTISLKLKTDYLKKKGLGGVMFWEYSDDYKTELLSTVYNELN